MTAEAYEYTLWNRLLAWLDWKEEWDVYYCYSGQEQKRWLVPYRFWSTVELQGCPHCGGEVHPARKMAGPDEYAL